MIVRDEKEEEEFHSDACPFFSHEGPPVVFSSFFVSSFSPEIEGEPESPHGDEYSHNEASHWELVLFCAVEGMYDEVCGISNGDDSPDSVDP